MPNYEKFRDEWKSILQVVIAWKLTNVRIHIHPEIYDHIDPLTDDQMQAAGRSLNRKFPYWCVFLSMPTQTTQHSGSTAIADGLFVINWRGQFDLDNGVTAPDSVGDCISWVNLGGTKDSSKIHFFSGMLFPFHTFLKTIRPFHPYNGRKIMACLSVAIDTINQHRESLGVHRPRATETKAGKKWMLSGNNRTFDIGHVVGDAIVSSRGGWKGGTHASPSPHIRRAHWHTFLVGPRKNVPKDERKRLLKWIPPVPVAMWNNTESFAEAI
jgi:hypothetical protein